MSVVDLPTDSASPNRAEHHRRQWRILEGLSMFDGGPLPVSASDARDIYALAKHDLIKFYEGRNDSPMVTLTGKGRRLLDERATEWDRVRAAGGEVRS